MSFATVMGKRELRRELAFSPKHAHVYLMAGDDYAEDPKWDWVPRHHRVRNFPLYEGFSDPSWRGNHEQVHKALDFIEKDVAADVPIAIACWAGINRSGTMATLAQMLRDQSKFCDALRVVRSARPKVAPLFDMAKTGMEVFCERHPDHPGCPVDLVELKRCTRSDFKARMPEF